MQNSRSKAAEEIGDNFSLRNFSLGNGTVREKKMKLDLVVNHLVQDEKQRKSAKDMIK